MKQMREIIPPKTTEALKIYAPSYYFIKGAATALGYKQTLIALPLGHHCHAGQLRKATINFEGNTVREPYYSHCLRVCSILMSLNLPLPDERLDRIYATALLHDTIEDCYVGANGEKLLAAGVSQEIVNNVLSLSKCSGADEWELNEYFYEISRDPDLLLVKGADRASNSESLYVFKGEKLDEYITETERWIYDMLRYGKEAYPELSNGLTILKSHIRSLVDMAKAMKEINNE